MTGRYMDVPLALRWDDGREERVTARPRDLMAWQKTGRGVTLEDVLPVNAEGDGLDLGKFNLPELWRLAWMVARREGLFDGPLEAFGEQVDVTVTEDGEEGSDTRPTNAAPSAAPSPSSPSKPASRPRSGQKRAPRS